MCFGTGRMSYLGSKILHEFKHHRLNCLGKLVLEIIVSCKLQPKHFNNILYHGTNRYSLNFGSINIQKTVVYKISLRYTVILRPDFRPKYFFYHIKQNNVCREIKPVEAFFVSTIEAQICNWKFAFSSKNICRVSRDKQKSPLPIFWFIVLK